MAVIFGLLSLGMAPYGRLVLAVDSSTLISFPIESDFIHIIMPYVRQETDFCVPACVYMVLSYIMSQNATVPDQYQLAKEMGATSGIGTRPSDMPIPFHNRGFTNVSVTYENTIDFLKRQLSYGYVSIVGGKFSIQGSGLHALAVIGYDERTEDKNIIVHDPGRGGPRRQIPYSQFSILWSEREVLTIPYRGSSPRIVVPEFSSSQCMIVSVTLIATMMLLRRKHAKTTA